MRKQLVKDYIEETILEIIANLQLDSRVEIPELSNTEISDIAEDFIYEWGETGDRSAELPDTLRTFLLYKFYKF